MTVFSSLNRAGREANENNIYFRCIQEPNNVALLYGRRPFGPSAPRGAHRFDRGTPKR